MLALAFVTVRLLFLASDTEEEAVVESRHVRGDSERKTRGGRRGGRRRSEPDSTPGMPNIQSSYSCERSYLYLSYYACIDGNHDVYGCEVCYIKYSHPMLIRPITLMCC